MAVTRLRKQGGAVVLTLPSDVALLMGWRAGIELDVKVFDESVSIQALKRVARGRKSLQDLLDGIHQEEIADLNKNTADDLASAPKGREMM